MSSFRSVCVSLLAGCGQPTPPPPPASNPPLPIAVMGAITGANVAWGDALVRGDTAVLASLYADDAILMAPEGDLAGKGAILPALLSRRRVGRDTLHATNTATDHLEVAGDRAYEAGTLSYTLVAPDGTRREVKVRYVSFWQLAGGRWLLQRSLRPLP